MRTARDMARRMLMCTITKRNKLCKYCNACINKMIKMKRPEVFEFDEIQPGLFVDRKTIFERLAYLEDQEC